MSKPGPPFLSPGAFVNRCHHNIQPNIPIRPTELPSHRRALVQPKSMNALKPNRPSYSETQNAPVNSFPANAVNKKQPNLLNQMINKLFNPEQQTRSTITTSPLQQTKSAPTITLKSYTILGKETISNFSKQEISICGLWILWLGQLYQGQ